ncbi:MAG: hypothetical protein AB8H86_26620 [Polyangiales bacterium]
MTLLSNSLSFLLPLLSLLIGCDDALDHHAPSAESSEAPSAEAPSAEALAAPPLPSERAEAIAIPSAGVALPVVMGDVQERPELLEAVAQGEPSTTELQLVAHANGVVSITASNLGGLCSAAPSFFARLETDGEASVIRLHQRPSAINAHCMMRYSAVAHVGALPAGRYGVAFGAGDVLAHATVEGSLQASALPGTLLSSLYTDQGEPNREATETTIEWDAQTQLATIRVTVPDPCGAQEPLPLWTSLDGTTLHVRMQQPSLRARCAALPRTIELTVQTSVAPTLVELH